MKLDRNANPDGKGKYALVHLRPFNNLKDSRDVAEHLRWMKIKDALEELQQAGVLIYGNESPDQQFFVLKYKDRFSEAALNGYATAIQWYAHELERSGVDAAGLLEYAADIRGEELKAQAVGFAIPD